MAKYLRHRRSRQHLHQHQPPGAACDGGGRAGRAPAERAAPGLRRGCARHGTGQALGGKGGAGEQVDVRIRHQPSTSAPRPMTGFGEGNSPPGPQPVALAPARFASGPAKVQHIGIRFRPRDIGRHRERQHQRSSRAQRRPGKSLAVNQPCANPCHNTGGPMCPPAASNQPGVQTHIRPAPCAPGGQRVDPRPLSRSDQNRGKSAGPPARRLRAQQGSSRLPILRAGLSVRLPVLVQIALGGSPATPESHGQDQDFEPRISSYCPCLWSGPGAGGHQFQRAGRRDHLPAWRVGLREVNSARAGGGIAAGATGQHLDRWRGAGRLRAAAPRPRRAPWGWCFRTARCSRT